MYPLGVSHLFHMLAGLLKPSLLWSLNTLEDGNLRSWCADSESSRKELCFHITFNAAAATRIVNASCICMLQSEFAARSGLSLPSCSSRIQMHQIIRIWLLLGNEAHPLQARNCLMDVVCFLYIVCREFTCCSQWLNATFRALLSVYC